MCGRNPVEGLFVDAGDLRKTDFFCQKSGYADFVRRIEYGSGISSRFQTFECQFEVRKPSGVGLEKLETTQCAEIEPFSR